eukprot:7351402-Pyramimonas_sp.AAC.1
MPSAVRLAGGVWQTRGHARGDQQVPCGRPNHPPTSFLRRPWARNYIAGSRLASALSRAMARAELSAGKFFTAWRRKAE